MPHCSPYLETTEFCNADEPRIRRLAAELTRDSTGDADKAIALFRFVRDSVRYRLGLYAENASDTLASGRGSCSNKANLLVALLRAAGLPAGYHVIQVKTKEYFGPLCSPVFHPFLSEKSLHVFCSVYLDGRWLKCDPSDDRELSEGTEHLNPQSRKVDFDGAGDALLNLTPEHIIADDGVRYDSIDGVFRKTRRCPALFLRVLDHYLDFLRVRGRAYSDVDELTVGFISWLDEQDPEGRRMLTGGLVGQPTA